MSGEGGASAYTVAASALKLRAAREGGRKLSLSLSLSTTQQSLHLPVKGGQFCCEGLGGGQGKLLARLWLLPWFVLHMFAVAAVVK